MKKIGLVYIKGAVPGFENFGELPTHLVKSNGLVDGKKASNELDALIIPGGTLLESGDISDDLSKEIKQIAKDGKPIIYTKLENEYEYTIKDFDQEYKNKFKSISHIIYKKIYKNVCILKIYDYLCIK